MERGQLLLGDAVAKHLPEFADVKLAHFEGETMHLRPPRRAPTVQDLLCHTAGLTYEITGSAPIQRMPLARMPSPMRPSAPASARESSAGVARSGKSVSSGAVPSSMFAGGENAPICSVNGAKPESLTQA